MTLPVVGGLSAEASLPVNSGVKNPQAILRYALQIDDKPIRVIQKELESISEALRIPGSKSLGPIRRAVSNAERTLEKSEAQIVRDFADDKKADGQRALADLKAALQDFDVVLKEERKQEIPLEQAKCLSAVTAIEEAMVKGFPFEVPAEYGNLPQLRGRAELEMKIRLKDVASDGITGGVFKIVLDGYNAPVSAGNFMDLVLRKFYDGMTIQRADGFVVQFGDPDGPAEGFVDPDTKEVRRIPFEVRPAMDKEPVYGITLEELGRANDLPALPFNAFGTLAVARAEFEPNSGSSQMFFLLKESELTPTGSNLLDGRYAVFGYITQGQELLSDMRVGDTIEYVKVTKGQDKLINSRFSQ